MAISGLPDEIDLIDLGTHRLRSLSRPEQVYQVGASGLSSEFPPLQTLSTAQTSLPMYPTTFVGRGPELDEIGRLLDDPDCRLLTLFGAGGMGKTRLAVEAASRQDDTRSHGAHFVSLAPVRSAELILPAVAESIGFMVDLHFSASLHPITQILDYLARQSMLLILDNLEHLAEADEVVAQILEHAPDLVLLVTSRQRLGIQAEWTFDVGGMRVPSDPSVEDIEAFSALKLFLDRSRRRDSVFELTESNRDGVIRICRLVGGMPLAVELAAGWVPMLAPDEIADEIAKNLDFLETSAADLDERHRSVRAVFDYSWSMLDEQQRAALCGLSAFAAPFGREAAEAVAGADLRSLREMEAKSLVKRESEGRFDLHPLLRQYATGELSQEGQDRVHDCHARFFLGRLFDREDDLKGGAQQIAAKNELLADLENLQAAAEWSAVHWPGDEVLRMLRALESFYVMYGWYDGREAFERIADRIAAGEGIDRSASPAPYPPYLRAMVTRAAMAASIGSLDEAEQIVRAQLPVWEELGDGSGELLALAVLGMVEATRGDYESAKATLHPVWEQLAAGSNDAWLTAEVAAYYGWSFYALGDTVTAKEIFEVGHRVSAEAGNVQALAYLVSKLGLVADDEGDHLLAKHYHDEARESFVKMGDLAGQAYTLSRLSATNWLLGDYDQARRDGLEAFEVFERFNHRWGVAASLCRVGFAELSMGDVDSARRRFSDALERSHRAELDAIIQCSLVGLGRVAAARGDLESAIELFSFVKAGEPVVFQYQHDYVDPVLPKIQAPLSEDQVAQAEARGRTASLEEIAALVT